MTTISRFGLRIRNLRGGGAAFLLLLLARGASAAQPGLTGELDAKGLSDAIARERGKVVLVNFWATWCVPCREEFPSLTRLQSKYGKELTVIGVSTDFSRQIREVGKFLAEQRPNFANYRKRSGGDDQEFIEALDPSWGGELPFSILYAQDGRKARALSGKQSYAAFEREVRKLIR